MKATRELCGRCVNLAYSAGDSLLAPGEVLEVTGEEQNISHQEQEAQGDIQETVETAAT